MVRRIVHCAPRGVAVRGRPGTKYRYVIELTTSAAVKYVRAAGPEWKQFRFSVGAPDAEAKYRQAIVEAQKESRKARDYPSLYVRTYHLAHPQTVHQ